MTIPRPLTVSELIVLRLAASGLTNKEIAKERNVDIETIKTQLRWCRSRLNATSTKQAISRAYEEGILP